MHHRSEQSHGVKPKRPTAPKAINIVRAFTQRWGHAGGGIDWGEPACFACGYFQERWDRIAPWDEATQGPTPDSVLNERWERSRLQKAHLTGYQFDGSNDPDNYAMLCRRCHIDAPDTPDAVAMVRWIERRTPFMSMLQAEIRATAPGVGERWVKAGLPRPDLDSVYSRGGVHFDPEYGCGMSIATLALVFAEAIEAALSKRSPGQMRLTLP